jgi:glycosyltransferase involved in cell wall biosynthesis
MGGVARVKIVHAAKFYPPVPGGMETVVQDLCEGTANDWAVRVISANTHPRTIRERVGEVDVVRAGCIASAHSVPLCPSLPLHLWREAADCVVLHEPNPLAGSALFLRAPAPRLIIWHHSDLLRPSWAPPTYGRVQRALYGRAECVIVSSPELAQHSLLVPHARRVETIPFGIDIDRFQRLDQAQRAKLHAIRTGVPGPRIVFVGRFVYYKGIEVLIDAMGACRGTLLLIGEGPLETELRRRAAARGLADRIVFVGRAPEADLPAYYHAADVFVLPSIAHTETFGIVQVEAMASGVPVISTALPTGVPWVNQDGVSGLVVPPRNVDALARGIQRLLDEPQLRDRLGRNAAARARALFSRQHMIDAFRAVVEAAVGTPAQNRCEMAGAEAS